MDKVLEAVVEAWVEAEAEAKVATRAWALVEDLDGPEGVAMDKATAKAAALRGAVIRLVDDEARVRANIG